MKEELIRDRLVVEVHDHTLSKHLQMKAELMLDKAKWLIRQREVVKEQEVLKQPVKEDTSLEAVSTTLPRRKLPTIPARQTLTHQN